MEKDIKQNDIIKEVINAEPIEKEYYTKAEVNELITKNINNALGDLIVKLNADTKPKEPEAKVLTKDDYIF